MFAAVRRPAPVPQPSTGQAESTGWPVGILAVLGTIVSALRPLSFDEMYWLSIARRVFGAGDLPYVDLLDNKGPLLYLFVGLQDLLPFSPRITLTLSFVVVVGAVASGVRALAAASGQTPRWQVFSIVLVTFSMMALSTWAVTTELITGALLLWAFATRQPWVRVALVLAGCLIDPRAVLFAPVVLAHGRERAGIGRSHLAVFGAFAGAALGTVFAVPALRYAFVEASLATRFDAAPSDLLLVTIAALTPLAALASFRFLRVPVSAIATVAIAAVIGLTAGLPYGHYWGYIVLAVPLLPIVGPRFSGPISIILGLGALIAVTLSTRDHLVYDVEQARINEPVAEALEKIVEPDDTVLIWASSPHLRLPIASQTLGFAPTSNYFAWGLPDPDRLLERLEADLAGASIVVVHPGLDGYRTFPLVSTALDLINARTSYAACSSSIGNITVYRFGSC